MRIIVADCSAEYTGRLQATLPMARRVLLIKADNSLLIFSELGSYKPLNWMASPCTITDITPDYADDDPATEVPQKVMILISSTAISLLVFNLLPDIKWLRPIGQDSLFNYLYHYIILIALIEPAVEYFSLPCSLPFILIYTAVILGILIPLSKVKILRWLTKPNLMSEHKNQA